MDTTYKNLFLVTTGDKQNKLDRLEKAFQVQLQDLVNLETIRLGQVDNLARAYHQVIMKLDNPDSLILFCHQDVYPLLTGEGVKAPNGLPEWLGMAFNYPREWWKVACTLFSKPDTGFLGVAGSLGLQRETAWWQYPDLSGAVVHLAEGNRLGINAYGHYGRVAVLDGLCMMIRQGVYQKLAPPSNKIEGFHFYDMDLSLRAHLAGLKNWTIPLLLVHESTGAQTCNNLWRSQHQAFLDEYYNQLPVNVTEESLPDS